MKILVIVNRAEFLLSHRYEICLEIIKRGYELHVISPLNPDVIPKFTSDGINHHSVEFFADSLRPDKLILSTLHIIKIINDVKPDLVHSIAMKPVVCGGIATRICSSPGLFHLLRGLV